MWSSFAIRLYRSVRRAALSGKPSRASTRDGFRDVDLAGLAYVQRAPLRPLQRFQRMESALVIHLAAAFYPVAQIDIVEIGQPHEADLFEHRQRSEAARLCLRIKEGIDRRERPRQMIDDGDSEQLFAVAKTPVAHIQQRAFEEGVEGFAILWIHAAAGVARSEEHTAD